MGERKAAVEIARDSRQSHLGALTGLRFFAAAHVLVFHAGLRELSGVPEWLQNVAGHADLSVSLFFILSGFILTYNYFDPVQGCRGSKAHFWAGRVARVYPIYALGLLLSVPQLVNDFVQQGESSFFARLAAALLVICLMQSWLPQTAWLWNFPSWSLSDEAFFYWSFPWLVQRIRRLTHIQLLLGVAIVWLVAQLPAAAAQALGPDGLGYIEPQAMSLVARTVQMNPLLRVPDFAIGILLGRLYLLRSGNRLADPVGAERLGQFLSIGGFVLLIAAVAVWGEYPFPVTLSRSLVAPFNAMLIYGLALGGGPLGNLLSTRGFVLLGNASYALYLLHVPVIFWTYTVAHKWFAATSPTTWAMFWADIVAAVGMSLLAFVLVEEPMRQLIRRVLIRRLDVSATMPGHSPAARN